jgi:glucose/arabinose dehydrogenase
MLSNCQTPSSYSYEVAFPNLTFNQPDVIFADPTNSSRLFVTEQAGAIRVIVNSQNASASAVFLDISRQVVFGGEEGLLGLAFHPNYTQNRFFYVDYVASNPLRTVIARFTTSADNPNTADPNSQQIILEFSQPYSNHKGGQLAFGPDGYLYIGVGDGGSEGDPHGNGQNRSTLLGKILRINVDAPSPGKNYSIPADNPFIGNSQGYREEIFAYGLRNPWRFSFDAAGQLWVGDVGQGRLEEIDLVRKGGNYGWNTMEGTLCYNPPSGCNQTGLELPIWNYTHDLGNAIIGGYVYHGSTLASLEGAYVYGDFGSGRIWALQYNGTAATNTQLANTGLNIASFGVDNQNQLFFAAYDGKIYRLTASAIPEYPSATAAASLMVVIVVLYLAVKIAGKKVRFRVLTCLRIAFQAFKRPLTPFLMKNGLSTAASIGKSFGPSPTA